MKKNTIILILVLVVLVIALGYFGYRQSKVNDGESSVATATSTATSTEQSTTTTPVPVVNSADWKTFRNDQYGIEFKYPPTWSPESYSNSSNDGQALYYRLMSGHSRYGSLSLSLDNRKSFANFLTGIKKESGTGVFPVFTVKEFKVGSLNSATITSVPGEVSYFIKNQVLELSSGSLLSFRLVVTDSKGAAEDDLLASQIKAVVASVREIK